MWNGRTRLAIHPFKARNGGMTDTAGAENGTLTERVCRTAISEELAPSRAILKDSQNVFRRFNRTVSAAASVERIRASMLDKIRSNHSNPIPSGKLQMRCSMCSHFSKQSYRS
ncbi:uncharacterized protein LOC143186257 [Calliopsis andreniformis]|uniref:uncharacterized protein LOC143186257 n=1 Tax=Calliopsis andreniformis TaxID=337506 RepID=UPI003FCDC215